MRPCHPGLRGLGLRPLIRKFASDPQIFPTSILQGDVHNRILLSYKWIMSLTEDDKKWITERLERVETSLLTEFHKWASPIDARMRTYSATLRAIDLEIEQNGDRLKKLEPPQA